MAGTDDGDEVAQLTSRVAVLLDRDEEDLRDRPLSLRCLVELLGTFLLTLVAAGGTYPDPTAGNGRAFMMEVVLTAILVSVILGTATGWRSS